MESQWEMENSDIVVFIWTDMLDPWFYAQYSYATQSAKKDVTIIKQRPEIKIPTWAYFLASEVKELSEIKVYSKAKV